MAPGLPLGDTLVRNPSSGINTDNFRVTVHVPLLKPEPLKWFVDPNQPPAVFGSGLTDAGLFVPTSRVTCAGSRPFPTNVVFVTLGEPGRSTLIVATHLLPPAYLKPVIVYVFVAAETSKDEKTAQSTTVIKVIIFVIVFMCFSFHHFSLEFPGRNLGIIPDRAKLSE
jgi:hypothetical protein